MLGSFRPTKWTLLQSFHFRILFWAKVNLKTKNLNCGPVAHGSGRQFRVTEDVWQEPTETVNGKAREVLGFTDFLRVVQTVPPQLDASELIFAVDHITLFWSFECPAVLSSVLQEMKLESRSFLVKANDDKGNTTPP